MQIYHDGNWLDLDDEHQTALADLGPDVAEGRITTEEAENIIASAQRQARSRDS